MADRMKWFKNARYEWALRRWGESVRSQSEANRARRQRLGINLRLVKE